MPPARRLFGALLTTSLITASAVIVGSIAGAGADPILPLPTTTTTAPANSTTTTAAPLPGPGRTTTTTARSRGTTTTSTTSTTVAPGGDGAAAGSQTIPPEYLPLIQGVHRSAPNSTADLVAALRPLVDLGLAPDEIVAAGFGHFPVGGAANFRDDWWEPRFTPTFHLHQGTDIFAAQGTPVRSPAAGILRQSNEAVGGMSAYVTTKDGTYFYMAHLSAFAAGQTTGQAVHAGDVVGYVGATGDAAGGAPHCHFEVHPAGGAATDPKPILDGWLADALAQAPAVVASFESRVPRALLATALTRGIDGFGTSSVFAAPSGPPRDQLLWVGAANPSGGALRIAQQAVADAARSIDWTAEASRAQASSPGAAPRG